MRLDSQLWRVFQNYSINTRGFCCKSKRLFSISQCDGNNKQKEDQSPFQPTKWHLRKADRFFEMHGPRAALEESGLRIDKFTKLKSLPEVALLGRTSVGKSSLINALLLQKKLARTSKTPGHTRLINYFNVGSKFYLVDLPGYGYVERQGDGNRQFVRIVEQYLKQRAGKQLRSVCLLIDGKVGVKKNDLIAIEMLEELDASFHIAVTKIDKVNHAHHELRCKQISKELGQSSTLCYPHVFSVSSKERSGLSELRYFLGLCTGVFE